MVKKVSLILLMVTSFNIVSSASIDFDRDKSRGKSGFNYKKHHRKSKVVRFKNRLLNCNNCRDFSNKN
jgi:hypothetical protein